MPENKLVFNDGSIIENGRAGYSQGILWCYFSGYTMAEIAAIFLNPQKTEKILFQYGEKEDVYEGFTVCTSMMIDIDGLAHVSLEKGKTEKDGVEDGTK